MSSSPSRPADAAHPGRVRRRARFAGAVLFSGGVLAGVAGAGFGGVGVLLDAALALGAVGLALALHGLGSADSGPAVRLSRAGLAVACLAVVAAPAGDLGAEFAVPGGPWGLLYGAGTLLVVLAETVVASVGSIDAGGVDVPERGTAGGRTPGGEAGPTVAVRRAEDGRWTWDLRTPEGGVAASAPQQYDTATSAHAAATRVADALDAEVTVVDDGTDTAKRDARSRDRSSPRDPGGAADPGEEDSPSGPGDLPSPAGGDPSVPSDERGPGAGDATDAPGGGRDAPEFVGGAGADRGVFEVEEMESGWRWRLRFDGETVVAESARSFPGLDATRRAIERVRTQAPGTGALTYDPGAFEVYREGDDEERWSWRLRAEDGAVVATAPATFGSRGDGFAAVERLKATAGLDPEVRTAEGHHRWELPVDGEAIARSPHGFESEAAAREAFDRVSAVVPEAGVLGLDPAGFEVGARSGGTWGWRLRHRDGRVVAHSPAQATRDRAIEGLRTVQRIAPDADVAIDERETARIIEEALSDAAEARSIAEGLRDGADEDGDGGESEDGEGRTEAPTGPDGETEAETGAVAGDGTTSGGDPGDGPRLVVVDGDGWEWELRRGESVLARAGGLGDRSVAGDAAAAVAAAMERATVLRVDPVATEVYHDDGWRWRLVDRAGDVLATATRATAHRRGARRDAETGLSALSGDPEVYRDEGWRWRVRDGDDVVAQSGRGFDSPELAREAFSALPEAVAGAPVSDCDAALEVFPAGGERWSWRLRHRDGRVVLAGESRFPSAEAATAALDGVVGREIPVVSEDGAAGDDAGEGG